MSENFDEIVDNETGAIIPADEADEVSMTPVMTRKQAEKCVNNIHKAIGSLRQNMLDLYNGRGWDALGYPTWQSLAFNLFGFQQRQARYLLETARVEAQTAPLLESGVEEGLLRRLSDDGIQALKHLHPEVRATVIRKLAESEESPTLRVVLETIPSNMLLPRQIIQLEKLYAKDNPTPEVHTVDFEEMALKNIATITKAIHALDNEDVYAAIGYATFADLVLNELALFGRIFDPDTYGVWGDWDSPDQVEYDPDDDALE